jgi:hypothetical protein
MPKPVTPSIKKPKGREWVQMEMIQSAKQAGCDAVMAFHYTPFSYIAFSHGTSTEWTEHRSKGFNLVANVYVFRCADGKVMMTIREIYDSGSVLRYAEGLSEKDYRVKVYDWISKRTEGASTRKVETPFGLLPSAMVNKEFGNPK